MKYFMLFTIILAASFSSAQNIEPLKPKYKQNCAPKNENVDHCIDITRFVTEKIKTRDQRLNATENSEFENPETENPFSVKGDGFEIRNKGKKKFIQGTLDF